MSWKEGIKTQLAVATRHNLVSIKLRGLIKDLLNGDSQFKMIYNNSSGKYDDLKITGELTINTKRIILQKHNIHLLKHLSNEKRKN